MTAKDNSCVELNPLEPTRQGVGAADSKSREMEVSKPVQPQKVKSESLTPDWTFYTFWLWFCFDLSVIVLGFFFLPFRTKRVCNLFCRNPQIRDWILIIKRTETFKLLKKIVCILKSWIVFILWYQHEILGTNSKGKIMAEQWWVCVLSWQGVRGTG